MKAAVVTRYGSPDCVEVREVPKPSPAAGELLIQVGAATVNRTDCGELRPRVLGRLIYGLLRPRRAISGMDVAGVVEAVGAGVGSFHPGDRVFGMCPYRTNGAHAEYVCVSETAPVDLMPATTSFAEAVVCEGAFYADNCLRKLRLGPGHKILIYGASGAIGSSAVQLAKSYGAEVTAVVATRHVALIESLGADRVIDYTAEDFSRLGERFDSVFDAVGKAGFFRCRRLLKPGGSYLGADIGPWGQDLPAMLGSWIARSRRVLTSIPEPGSGRRLVGLVKRLLESGQFRAVIDRKYPLDEIAEAYRYVETGQKAGIVVIDVSAPPGPRSSP